eukprot:13230768-Alexandrium_andersonii.AAC.1
MRRPMDGSIAVPDDHAPVLVLLVQQRNEPVELVVANPRHEHGKLPNLEVETWHCLLYTSDAADDM